MALLDVQVAVLANQNFEFPSPARRRNGSATQPNIVPLSGLQNQRFLCSTAGTISNSGSSVLATGFKWVCKTDSGLLTNTDRL